MVNFLQIFIILFCIISTAKSQDLIANDNNSSAKIYHWKVIRVVDGDTLEIANEFLPEELKLFVRIKGIDTPEKFSRAKCASEKKLGQQATDYTTLAIKTAQQKKLPITFSEIKWDKYGGRIVATVKIAEKNLGDELINKGLARPYFGEKKSSWCKK
jgi:endonuclease YncB( thermonuclease family)